MHARILTKTSKSAIPGGTKIHFISPHFHAVRKAQSFHLFSQQWEAGPWSSETARGAPDAKHDVVTQQPGTPSPRSVSCRDRHGVTFCQGMQQKLACQQEQQNGGDQPSSPYCALAWALNWSATWEQFSPRQLSINTMIPLWASCIDQTGKRNKYRRAGDKIHHKPPHLWPKQKASYHLVLANSMCLQAGPQRKTFHIPLQNKPCLGDKEQKRY